MTNIVQFPNKIPETERDYMPIMRDRVIIELQVKAERRSRFWTTALASAALFTLYGLILLRFAEVI